MKAKVESLPFLNAKVSAYKSQLLSDSDFKDVASSSSLKEVISYLSSKEPYHSFMLKAESEDPLHMLEKSLTLYLKERLATVEIYYPRKYEANLKLFLLDTHFNFLKYLVGSKVMEDTLLLEVFPLTKEEEAMLEQAKGLPLRKIILLSPYLSRAYEKMDKDAREKEGVEFVVALSQALDEVYLEEIEKVLKRATPLLREFIQDYFDWENAVLSIYYRKILNADVPFWYPGKLREKLFNVEYAEAFLKRFGIEGSAEEMELKVKNLLYRKARAMLPKVHGKPEMPIFYLFSLRGEIKLLGRIAKGVLMNVEREFIEEVLM